MKLQSQKIEINDYRQAIDVLIKCSKHLNKLQVAWSEIKDFFVKVAEMLNGIKYNSNQLKNSKDNLLELGVDFVDIIMENLKEGTVDAYSRNIYVMKVAEFYIEIMETGLLKKIRGLNFECKDEICLENTKEYIVEECKATQKVIREKVRYTYMNYLIWLF